MDDYLFIATLAFGFKKAYWLKDRLDFLRKVSRMSKWSNDMTNLISRAIALTSAFLKELQLRRFLAVVLVGFILLTINGEPGSNNQAASERVKALVDQNDSQRPKTTGEWNKEARETRGSPGERLQKIAGESAEAVKDFGSLYPDTAKKSAPDLGDKAAQAGKGLANFADSK